MMNSKNDIDELDDGLPEYLDLPEASAFNERRRRSPEPGDPRRNQPNRPDRPAGSIGGNERDRGDEPNGTDGPGGRD